VLALRRLVREARDEPIRTRLVRLTGVRGLSDAAINALETIRIGRVDSVFAHGAHLARAPRRRRRLSRSRVPTRLSGRLAQRMPVDAMAARAVPSILAGSNLVRSQVDHRLATLAAHPDRLASVLATIRLLQQPPDDEHRCAIESVLARAVDPLVTRLIESGSRPADGIKAMHELSDFESALMTRPGWWCAACALEHLRSRPDALEPVLRRTLQDGCDRACSAAVDVISRRRMVPRFESDLVSIVEAGPGGRPAALVARVLRLLANGPTGRSARAIVRSLGSRHPELQAEALAAATDPKASVAVRVGCSLVDVALLERLTESSESRVRSGALRALRLRSESRARSVVRRLLDDDSPELRLTGLDAVRSAGDPDYRGPVLRLMERELLPEIMTRGRAVLRFLESRTRITSPDPVMETG
jgi:hypothetical protein